jgi:5-methylcytosine-specific restriction endonuclease McrA
MGVYIPFLPPSDWNRIYDAHIASEAWEQKRKARLKIDDYTCQRCGATGVVLDVHHKAYDRVPNENIHHDLITLCHDCHVAVHREKANQKRRKRK